MASKNNPNGTKIQIGCLVEPELLEEFDQLIKDRCLQKTSVLRKLIGDFVKTKRFATEND